MNFRLWNLIPLLIVTACATAPGVTKQQFQAVHDIPAGQSIVYVYRPNTGFARHSWASVFVDGESKFKLITNSYGYVLLPAGKHEIRVAGTRFSFWTAPPEAITVEVEAGREYYLRVEKMAPGGPMPDSFPDGSLLSIFEALDYSSKARTKIELLDKKLAIASIRQAGLAEALVPESERGPEKIPSNGNFSGTYATSRISASRFGSKYLPTKASTELVLVQTGNRISGTMDHYQGQSGSVYGTVQGNTINYRWRSASGRSGGGKWRLNDDRTGLVGEWHTSGHGISGPWNLTLIEAPEPPVQADAPTTQGGQSSTTGGLAKLSDSPAAASNAGSAAEPVSPMRMRALISGNTSSGKSENGHPLHIYNSPEGKMYGLISDSIELRDSGTWEINEAGQYCRQWKNWRTSKRNCYLMYAAGENSFRIKSLGTSHEVLFAIRPGDPENLVDTLPPARPTVSTPAFLDFSDETVYPGAETPTVSPGKTGIPAPPPAPKSKPAIAESAGGTAAKVAMLEGANTASNISGTYVSSITSKVGYMFQNPKHRKLVLDLKQDGNVITGSDRLVESEIRGTLEGNTVKFSFWTGKINAGLEVEGEWEIHEDGRSLKGSWRFANSGAGGGKWDLVKSERASLDSPVLTEPVPTVAIPKQTASVESAPPAAARTGNSKNFTGTYQARVTGAIKRFTRASSFTIELVQEGNNLTGTFLDGSQVAGEVYGSKVVFDWSIRGVTGDGKWIFGEAISGTWFNAGMGEGRWDLSRIESERGDLANPTGESNQAGKEITAGISGVYQSEISRNLGRFFEDNNIRIRLVQNGNRITGSFIGAKGDIWGEINGDTINFTADPQYGTYHIKGNWAFSNGYQQAVGKATFQNTTQGYWNLTRVE